MMTRFANLYPLRYLVSNLSKEIRIALTFLKKRFRDYTLKEIVQALTEYLVQK